MSSDVDLETTAAGRPNGIDNIIGSQLRKIREDRRMSEPEFARLLGMSPKLLGRFELAQQRIPASRLMHIANTLAISIGYFFEPLALVREPVPDNVVLLNVNSTQRSTDDSCHEEQLLKCFRLIPDKRDRQFVIDLTVRLAPDCHSRSGDEVC